MLLQLSKQVKKIETMGIDRESIIERRLVWEIAGEMIDPIVEKHGLEKQVVGGLVIPQTVYSKVDQHLDSIERVAQWLLGEVN